MDLILEDINKWNREGKYEKIIDTLSKQENLSYDLRGKLISAFNNNEDYLLAYNMLDLISDQGSNDPVWYFRKGFAAYYLEKYEEARVCFSTVLEYLPGNEDALEFLADCHKNIQVNTQLQMDATTSIEDFELKVEDFTIIASEIMVRLAYCADTREVSVEYFHYRLKNITEENRYNVICTALEYILGEEFFKTYIGSVDFNESTIETMVSIINIGVCLDKIVQK